MADEADSGNAAADQAGPPEANPVTAQAKPSATESGPATPSSAARLPVPPGFDEDEDGDEDDGYRRGRIRSALATLFGAVSLVGGLTWMLLNLHGPSPVVDIATGIVLALGGLVLLMPHRIHLPGPATGIAAASAGVVGTAAGIAASTATVCCMFAYVVERGFPFRWLRRGAVADDPEVARRLAATDSWHVDVAGLTMNVIVWAYLGVLIVALVVLVRRARGSVGGLP